MKTNHFRIIGLMSGSSLDGVDLVHCEFDIQTKPQFEIVDWSITHAQTIPFDQQTISRIKHAINLSGKDLALLDHDLGRLFGEMIQNFIEINHLDPDFISSHGHTVFHYPTEGFTLQIGHPSEIVAKTGLPVIGDFRSTDIALNGQGAPFAPIVDRYLFSNYDVLVNLGGIMNASFLNDPNNIIAFDIAPCNQTLNHLASALGHAFDNRGRLAAGGTANPSLLSELSYWPFFAKTYPKSLDNTEIQTEFHAIIHRSAISLEDKLATVVELIALKLKEAVETQLAGINPKILLTGGGAFNDFMVHCFRKNIPNATIIIPDEILISFKEGLLMTLMGLLRVSNQVNVMKSVTGGKSDHVAGAIYQGLIKKNMMVMIDKNSRILVSGASGYLGKEILIYLSSLGYKRLTGITRKNVVEMPKIPNVDWITLDILDVLGLEDALENQDVVIHAAGMVSYQPSDKMRIFKTNVEGTANMVNCALTKNVKLMIHISSTAAFGIPAQPQIITEKFLPDPSQFITDYALSKWYGELEVWRGMKEGLQATIICPSIIIGPTKELKNTDIFIKSIKAGLEKCPAGGSGFVDHRDISRAIAFILENGITDKKYILSSGNLSWMHFFGKIANIINKPSTFSQISSFELRILSITNFIKKLIGIKVSVPTNMANHMMQKLDYDGSQFCIESGLKYTPIDTTIKEYCEANALCK